MGRHGAGRGGWRTPHTHTHDKNRESTGCTRCSCAAARRGHSPVPSLTPPDSPRLPPPPGAALSQPAQRCPSNPSTVPVLSLDAPAPPYLYQNGPGMIPDCPSTILALPALSQRRPRLCQDSPSTIPGRPSTVLTVPACPSFVPAQSLDVPALF